MENEELKVLINQIDQSSLSYFDYQTESHHLILSKEMPEKEQLVINDENKEEPIIKNPKKESDAEKIDMNVDASREDNKKLGETIDSPMIGVAYLQANPDEEKYVSVGDYVEKGDTVCIIEAMKLMNEIEASKSGEVTEILIENEEVVEYNQPLIRIK
ncbi:MAG: acetyl-CoA carboxylase biotin carboxyl carrier protein [Alkalibacterium sp.]|nr:acetyl-CoA carboxylase biotin carboxyl carrier protein [Alkalibacterium sp.]